jgi:TolB protein
VTTDRGEVALTELSGYWALSFASVAGYNGQMTPTPARHAVLALALALALASCSDDADDTTTTSTPAPTPSTTAAVTTSAATTTTPAATTTTAGTTTTVQPGEVTIDPNLPAAVSRDQIPWSEVGSGWYVVLYDASKAYPTGESDVRDGPSVLYLTDRGGTLYEIAAWDPGLYPFLIDATAESALIVRNGATIDDTLYERIDFATGTASDVYEVGWPESSYLNTWPHAALTRPTGANVAVLRSDGTTEWLERRAPDGSVLAEVYEQPVVEDERSMSWLYSPAGTSLLVAHHGGVAEVANDGTLIADLWVPQDTWCDPVRWWDADAYLATCYGQGPASAPADEYGSPATHYGRLWLLETDGSAGLPLTEFPPDPPIVVDFGYHDAWPTSTGTFLQWSGDCGAAQVATLNADGTGTFMGITLPPDLIADGIGMVDIVGDRMAIYGWQGCDAWVGSLFTVDLDGTNVEVVVPVIGDGRGVVGVEELATVYP